MTTPFKLMQWWLYLANRNILSTITNQNFTKKSFLHWFHLQCCLVLFTRTQFHPRKQRLTKQLMTDHLWQWQITCRKKPKHQYLTKSKVTPKICRKWGSKRKVRNFLVVHIHKQSTYSLNFTQNIPCSNCVPFLLPPLSNITLHHGEQ